MAQPNILLATLEPLARQRADMVGSLFVTSAEVQSYLQAAWERFYMILVSKFDGELGRKKAASPLLVGPSTVTVNLASDFLKLQGVRIRDKEFLRRVDLKEIAPITWADQTGRPQFYTTENPGLTSEPAQTITVYPRPDASYTIDYWYTPYVALEDVFATSGYKFALWRDYIVTVAAIMMKDKEESDCSVLLAEKAEIYALIEKSLTPLDQSEPPTIISTMQRPSLYGDPFIWEDFNG